MKRQLTITLKKDANAKKKQIFEKIGPTSTK